MALLKNRLLNELDDLRDLIKEEVLTNTGKTISVCSDNVLKEISTKKRTLIHLGFAFIVFLLIVIFNSLNNDSLINSLIRVAGYTYGPLLGLFAFGILSKRKVVDSLVPYIAVLSPLISVLLYLYSEQLFGFEFGFEILLINGGLMIIGLWLTSLKYKK